MRWAALSLAICGCNAIFGITEAIPVTDDAATGSDTCAPLGFDINRYEKHGPGNTWQQARDLCIADGFDLAVFDEGDMQEATNEYTGAQTPFWLGTRYVDGDWTSIDGCPPRLDWGPNEPGTMADGDCLALAATGMTNLTCTQTLGDGEAPLSSLCEMPRPSSQCLAQQSQHTYMTLAVTEPQQQAAADCGALGPGWHLVEINSTDELSYLLSHDASGLPAWWIAATFDNTTWTSPTGCPQIFTWQTGGPGTNGPCAVYQSSAMAAEGCVVGAASVICEQNQ